MLPTHQFGHIELVAVRLQLQAAQYIGQMTTKFTGVQGMMPDFAQGVARKRAAFDPA
jgi:hypothetical protein